jgi:hypothetical protein
MDPTHVPAGEGGESAAAAHVPTPRDFQLCLGTELVQAGEVLFQPAMVGPLSDPQTHRLVNCISFY